METIKLSAALDPEFILQIEKAQYLKRKQMEASNHNDR